MPTFEEVLGLQPVVAVLHTNGEGHVFETAWQGEIESTARAESLDMAAAAFSVLGQSMDLGELRVGVLSFANGHVAIGRVGPNENVGILADEDAKVGLLLHQLRELVTAMRGT